MNNNPFSRGSASQSIVINLIILNAIVFLAQTLLPRGTEDKMIDLLGLHFWKSDKFYIFQTVTYMFLHGSFSHLFFNMFALWMFGRVLEYDLGGKRFLVYYMITGIGAGLINLGVNYWEYSALSAQFALTDPQGLATWVNQGVTIGASGAVFGILLAFGMMHPNDRIMLLIPPIPLKAKYFVIIYGLLELYLGVTGRQSNIAHFAHLGGMIFGFALLKIWKSNGKIYY